MFCFNSFELLVKFGNIFNNILNILSFISNDNEDEPKDIEFNICIVWHFGNNGHKTFKFIKNICL